eukprot:TRINITY_DN3759_c0_g2_i9.p3 TRINITY_DN3759_c0_g2~~TRINITY_DN3759_c0_g2_i9.p3  ORF type:complete len:131 (+),score=1.99 TRINITY_DN3759_c0_g2_i9:979-1371(+)
MAALLFISWFKGLWAHRWRWFDSHSCGQWKTYLNSMVSIGFLIYRDWLAFEIFTIQASRLRLAKPLLRTLTLQSACFPTEFKQLPTRLSVKGYKKKAIAYRYMGSSTISFKPFLLISVLWLQVWVGQILH